jgi:aspartyl-tRNA(Asn)/glutamyl-tRNA(Gln) amidotransferase subunit A
MTEKRTRSAFTLRQLSDKIKTQEVTPVDLVKNCIERIKKSNPLLNAFITVIEEDAYKEAEIAEIEIKNGRYLGPFHGIPYSVKDIFDVKDIRCTVGSKILSDNVSKIDATVIRKMRNAGAILVGKNTLDEFAFGITGMNPYYGSSKNPWDTSKISGGSGGGSAVAVATGMVPFSLATDTGGSLRAPASLCGVVGLKPTYGTVSKYGVFPVAPSMDHVGCITRSTWDAAAVLECISGIDPLDETTNEEKIPNYTRIIERSIVEKISVGIPKSYFLDYLSSDVERLFYSFIDVLKSMEIRVDEVELHNTDQYFEPSLSVARAEAAEIHLEWLKTRIEDYTEVMRKRFQHGRQVIAVDYIRYKKIIKEIRNELLRILKYKVDVIAVPTTIITAPRFDEVEVIVKDKLFSVNDALTWNNIIFNSTGLPAISIPSALTKDLMPVGVQIVGSPYDEAKILTIAHKYECINDSVNKMMPPSCG